MKNFLSSPLPRTLPRQGGGNPLPALHPPRRLRRLDSRDFGALSSSPRKLPNKTKIGTPHFWEQSYAPELLMFIVLLFLPFSVYKFSWERCRLIIGEREQNGVQGEAQRLQQGLQPSPTVTGRRARLIQMERGKCVSWDRQTLSVRSQPGTKCLTIRSQPFP